MRPQQARHHSARCLESENCIEEAEEVQSETLASGRTDASAAGRSPMPKVSVLAAGKLVILNTGDLIVTWVVVKIMVPFSGPYYNTAPNI